MSAKTMRIEGKLYHKVGESLSKGGTEEIVERAKKKYKSVRVIYKDFYYCVYAR